MGRSYRLLLGVLVAAVVVPVAVYAGIPDPSLSDAPNVIYSPGGNLEYIVTVNGSSGPISGATVQVIFSPEADSLVQWCVGQTHPTIEATTDANGEAHFFIGAGGCIDPSQASRASGGGSLRRRGQAERSRRGEPRRSGRAWSFSPGRGGTRARPPL